MGQEPVAELQTAFSSPGATATAWADAREHLEKGRDLLGDDGASGRTTARHAAGRRLAGRHVVVLHGRARKAKNLAANPHVVMTTGCNAFRQGFDVVVEGEARRVVDEGTLRRAADAFAAKYDWRFDVRDGAFHEVRGPDPNAEPEEGGRAIVFQVRPTKIFGYGRDETFSAARWRF